MLSRALTSDGDWTFGKGKQNYKQRANAVEQNIRTRLNSFLGDCFFDEQAGINWFSLLGGKNMLAIQLSISTCLLNTLEVTGNIEINVTLNNNREMTVTYVVSTVYGVLRSQALVGV